MDSISVPILYVLSYTRPDGTAVSCEPVYSQDLAASGAHHAFYEVFPGSPVSVAFRQVVNRLRTAPLYSTVHDSLTGCTFRIEESTS